jgi:hypothetical protein
MSRTWDIIDDLFSTDAHITHTVTSHRRPVADVSSMLRLAVVVSLTAAATASAHTVISPVQSDGVSDVRVVLQRSPIALRKAPEKEKRAGVDFTRGRSAEKLANSFKGYFRPSTHVDDSSDEGFVFD